MVGYPPESPEKQPQELTVQVLSLIENHLFQRMGFGFRCSVGLELVFDALGCCHFGEAKVMEKPTWLSIPREESIPQAEICLEMP